MRSVRESCARFIIYSSRYTTDMHVGQIRADARRENTSRCTSFFSAFIIKPFRWKKTNVLIIYTSSRCVRRIDGRSQKLLSDKSPSDDVPSTYIIQTFKSFSVDRSVAFPANFRRTLFSRDRYFSTRVFREEFLAPVNTNVRALITLLQYS